MSLENLKKEINNLEEKLKAFEKEKKEIENALVISNNNLEWLKREEREVYEEWKKMSDLRFVQTEDESKKNSKNFAGLGKIHTNKQENVENEKKRIIEDQNRKREIDNKINYINGLIINKKSELSKLEYEVINKSSTSKYKPNASKI